MNELFYVIIGFIVASLSVVFVVKKNVFSYMDFNEPIDQLFLALIFMLAWMAWPFCLLFFIIIHFIKFLIKEIQEKENNQTTKKNIKEKQP